MGSTEPTAHLSAYVACLFVRGDDRHPLRHGVPTLSTAMGSTPSVSFEETDILCENGKGVTSSIMMGQLVEMGTGSVDVLFPDSLTGKKNTITRKGRVIRSTCRAFVTDTIPEIVEYVLDEVTPSLTRPSLPPPSTGTSGSEHVSDPCPPTRSPRDVSLWQATGKVVKVCSNKCAIRITKTENALILFGGTKKRDCDVQEDKGGPVESSRPKSLGTVIVFPYVSTDCFGVIYVIARFSNANCSFTYKLSVNIFFRDSILKVNILDFSSDSHFNLFLKLLSFLLNV